MGRYFVLCAGILLCVGLVACESDDQKAANKATVETNEARKVNEADSRQKEEENRQRIYNRTNIWDTPPKTNGTSKQ